MGARESGRVGEWERGAESMRGVCVRAHAGVCEWGREWRGGTRKKELAQEHMWIGSERNESRNSEREMQREAGREREREGWREGGKAGGKGGGGWR